MINRLTLSISFDITRQLRGCVEGEILFGILILNVFAALIDRKDDRWLTLINCQLGISCLFSKRFLNLNYFSIVLLRLFVKVMRRSRGGTYQG